MTSSPGRPRLGSNHAGRVAGQKIEATGVSAVLARLGGGRRLCRPALRRFATFANHQEVEIGAWGHGGGTFETPYREAGRWMAATC